MTSWLFTPEPPSNGVGTLTTEKPSDDYLTPAELAERLGRPLPWCEEQSWRLPVRRRFRTSEWWVHQSQVAI